MDDKSTIAEQAAEWVIRLQTATPEVCAAFVKWLIQSPLHIGAFLEAQAGDVEFRELFRNKHFDADEFIRSANNVHEISNRDGHVRQDTPPATPVARVARSKTESNGANRTRRITAAAATFVALLAMAAVVYHDSSARRITTAAGEWQTKVLSDGTILRVGPRTKIVIEFTDERRLVRLVQGEALFHVAPNAQRPFVVETELATARAVGTAFAVSLDGARPARITVKEGVVAVTRRSCSQAHRTATSAPGQSVMLKAGEQVAVTASSDSLAAELVDIDKALAWADGRLIFEHETVEQAIREFNRRNELQIKVLDQALLQRAVRGTFEASNPQSFATELGKLGAFAVVTESGTILIARYPGASASETNR